MPENYSAQTLNSIVAPTSTVGSSISGVGVGTGQSGKGITQVFQETDLGERDSLLKALHILFNAGDAQEERPLGLDLAPDAFQNILGLTRQGVASAVNHLLLAPVASVFHTAQLPLDFVAASEGVSNSLEDRDKFFQTKQASTLDVDKEMAEKKSNFSANCQALSQNFSNIFDKMSEQLDDKIEVKGSAAKSHIYLIRSLATSSALSALGTAGVVALMVDMIGSSLRELSGVVEFSKQESLSAKENNIYQAFKECCQVFAKSNHSKESLQALRKLEKALLDFNLATDMVKNHALTSPAFSVFMRMITAEPFVRTLMSVNASSLGLTEANQALHEENQQSSDNVRQSIPRASLIEEVSGGDAHHHSQNVSDFCDQFDEAIRHIDKQLEGEDNQKLVGSSAKSTVRSHSALVIASSLIPGFTGLISREFSGSIDFTRHDKGTKAECQEVSHSRKDLTGDDLDKLMTRVCELKERIERCQELGVSAPVVLGVSEVASSGALVASLNVVAGMVSALKELRTLSDSPSKATELNDEEKDKAKKYVESAVEANKKTGKSTGMESASNNLSMHQKLQSVMNKVVLIHRSYGDFRKIGADRHDINSVGKSTIGFSQGNSSGFLLGALGIIALTALESGIGLETLLGSFLYSTQARRVSDGVDKIELGNGSKSNLSSVSNSTRLIEEEQNSRFTKSVSRATYLGSEALSSRSLTVALCQSGALTEILRRLSKDETDKIEKAEGHLKSTVASDAMMPKLYDKILEVLDEAEKENNPIPGLNKDMASSLASASNTAIASALASHSAFITPIMKSIAAAKNASNIDEEQKREALSGKNESTRVMSVVSNVIQAFTRNFKEEIGKLDNPIEQSTAIRSSERTNDTTLIGSCLLSLLCEELFEICVSRSLTLLDKEKVIKTAKESNELSTKEAGLSTDAVKEDSGLGQENNISHILSAMRLTLSRLGVALGDLASDLETKPDLLKPDLELHSTQQAFIRSMTTSLGSFSTLMLGLSAGLSNFPVSTGGVADSARETLHSTDHNLVLEPVHSSAGSSEDCGTESSIITGISTDCASSILTSATKLLLQASILGLDSTLAMVKIMEILTIHPRPLDALALETKASSQPNGFSHNVDISKENSAVMSTLGLASAIAASKTGQSGSTDNALNRLQRAVDNRIEQISLLEDEEEDEKLGLKRFYELLICVLDGRDDPESHQDLVKRFDQGGIALSNYHSAHGGITNSDRKGSGNRLIRKHGFMNCDDAGTLLETFINKAFSEERSSSSHKLDSLKEKLIGQDLSSKVQQRWQYIVNRVMDRLKSEHTRQSLWNPSRSRLNLQNLEQRKQDLLTNWMPKVEDEHHLESKNESVHEI